MVKVARGTKELSSKIYMIKKEYENKYNEDISIEKLAQILKVSKEEIAASIAATSNNMITSIYESIKDDKKICLIDTLKSEKNEENEITNKITIQKLISELEPRDREIIVLRYFKGETQNQVSKKLGISQVQISRIEKKLLIQMREKIVC